jgi:hypothetical protein
MQCVQLLPRPQVEPRAGEATDECGRGFVVALTMATALMSRSVTAV